MGRSSEERLLKLERESKQVVFTRSQFRLKKAGPKPSGPELFMENKADRISSREKGRTREAA
jgi:hypothetical protein